MSETTVEAMPHAAEREEESDDKTQEESAAPGSRKRERKPKLRHPPFFTDREQTTLGNAFNENPFPFWWKLEALADELDKPVDKVSRWFTDQRKKQRRLEIGQEEESDDETQEESAAPGSRKRERKPKLRHPPFFTDREQTTLGNTYNENPFPFWWKLEALADELDKPVDKVSRWFTDQREKQRRLETEQEEQSGDEPHEESAAVTQELELKCVTPKYSMGQESPGLEASEVSTASAEVGMIPRIPDGFQLFGIGSAIFTSHDMIHEHKLQEAALKMATWLLF